MVGGDRIHDLPKSIREGDHAHGCGIIDDKGFATEVSHVTKSSCDLGAKSNKRACSTTGRNEENGLRRTEYHNEAVEEPLRGPILDVSHLRTYGEKGTSGTSVILKNIKTTLTNGGPAPNVARDVRIVETLVEEGSKDRSEVVPVEIKS